MAQTAAEKTAVPLEMRPSLALRLSALTWGGLVAGLLIAGALVFHTLMERAALDPGDGPVDLGFATRVALVASLSVGYTLAVWRWISAAQSRDFIELGLLPEGSDEDLALIYSVSPAQLRGSRLAGLAGIAFFVGTVEIPSAIGGASFGTAWTSLHALSYMLFLGVLFFWVAGRAAYFSIGRSRFQIVLGTLEIDLLDRKPVQVFGRIGLRNALMWVVGISIGMLAFVNPELRILESLIVLVPVLLVTAVIASAALLLPVRGLHARIVAAKHAELERVEAAIRGDLSALEGSRIADRQPPPSLADLIAYKGLVEAVRDWPFDGSTLRRLGLYLLIPLGSWVGGALVERGVGVLLD
jgi:hypothetical protein